MVNGHQAMGDRRTVTSSSGQAGGAAQAHADDINLERLLKLDQLQFRYLCDALDDGQTRYPDQLI